MRSLHRHADPIDAGTTYTFKIRDDIKFHKLYRRYEHYRENYTAYCGPEVDKLVGRQSAEIDVGKRKQLVWEIEKKLAADDARCFSTYAGRSAGCPN